MSVRLLIDMNLSPNWVDALASQGWDCVHWSSVGDPTAPDQEIMAWALANDRIVFTHDLDFWHFAGSNAGNGPSVIQVRGQNILPDHMASLVVAALKQHESDLESGALLVVEESKLRVRVLPI